MKNTDEERQMDGRHETEKQNARRQHEGMMWGQYDGRQDEGRQDEKGEGMKRDNIKGWWESNYRELGCFTGPLLPEIQRKSFL